MATTVESYAAVLYATTKGTTISVHHISTTPTSNAKNIILLGEAKIPKISDSNIYKSTSAARTIQYLLSDIRQKMRDNKAFEDPKPATIPVFFISTVPIETETETKEKERFKEVHQAVDEAYYANGVRFSMIAEYPGNAHYPGLESKTEGNLDEMLKVLLEKGKEIIVEKFEVESKEAAVEYPDSENVFYYRYERVSNDYFQLPPTLRELEEKRGQKIPETHTLNLILRPVAEDPGNTAEQDRVIPKLADSLKTEEQRRDEVTKYFSKTFRYGAIMDAGSSGTRVFVYKWTERYNGTGQLLLPGHEEMTLVDSNEGSYKNAKGEKIKQISVGISDLGKKMIDDSRLIPEIDDRVQEYLGYYTTKIREILSKESNPPSIKHVPLYMFATGGMRQLKIDRFEIYSILRTAITNYLNKSGFLHPTYDTISGEDEGMYGWIGANFNAKKFSTDPLQPSGFLEMGGQTAQIAFTRPKEDWDKYEGPLTRVVLGPGRDYDLFTKTWGELGANAMWNKHKKKLRESLGDLSKVDLSNSSNRPRDPCWPKLHTYPLELKTGAGTKESKDGARPALPEMVEVIGAGNMIDCARAAFDVVQCEDGECRAGNLCFYRRGRGCLLDKIPGLVLPGTKEDEHNPFIGSSVFYYATNGMFGGDQRAEYDLVSLWSEANALYGLPWEEVKKKRPEVDDKFLGPGLFNAGLVLVALHLGFGVPMPEHAARCVRLAVTWYAKEERAVNEGRSPVNELLDSVDDIVGQTVEQVVKNMQKRDPKKLEDNLKSFVKGSTKENEDANDIGSIDGVLKQALNPQDFEDLWNKLKEGIGAEVENIQKVEDTLATIEKWSEIGQRLLLSPIPFIGITGLGSMVMSLFEGDSGQPKGTKAITNIIRILPRDDAASILQDFGKGRGLPDSVLNKLVDLVKAGEIKKLEEVLDSLFETRENLRGMISKDFSHCVRSIANLLDHENPVKCAIGDEIIKNILAVLTKDDIIRKIGTAAAGQVREILKILLGDDIKKCQGVVKGKLNSSSPLDQAFLNNAGHVREALEWLRDQPNYPDTPYWNPATKVLNRKWVEICFDFITKCMSWNEDALSDNNEKKLFNPQKDLTWTLGTMLLQAVGTRPYVRTKEAWSKPSDDVTGTQAV